VRVWNQIIKHTGDALKKYFLFIVYIYASMANSALSMETTAYLPQLPSTYALATLITGMYCASYLYTQYANPTRSHAISDTFGLLTCVPMHKDAQQDKESVPWHALVERMQQDTMEQESIVSLDSHDIYQGIQVQKGIVSCPDHSTLCVFSRGYASRGTFLGGKPRIDLYQDVVTQGGGLMGAHMVIKDNLITDVPCYSFDYSDTRSSLNLGQSHDVARLKTVWEEVIDKNPQAKIIGIGDCRGSKTLLEFATEQPAALKALVLMAPFVSLKELAYHIARNYLKFPFADKLLYAVMRLGLPNVDLNADNLADRLPLIDPSVPVFIAHRKNDAIISYNDIKLLVNSLLTNGNPVYLLELADDAASHSRLSHIPEFQQALNAFYARYNAPHNESLAGQGKQALDKAQDAAKALFLSDSQ
jgi:hypothetical protein